MKLRAIYLCCLVALFSCNSHKKQEVLISNHSKKYWDMVFSKDNEKRCKEGYCFLNSGRYQIYYYYKGKRYNSDPVDIEYNRDWKLLNDSTLALGHERVHILKQTRDTFILQFKDLSVVKFVASKNQTDTVLRKPNFEKNIIWDTTSVVPR